MSYLSNPLALVTVRKLGDGSFGTVTLVKDPNDNDKEYAVKSEPLNAEIPQLEYESKIYSKLKNVKNVPTAFALWKSKTHLNLAMDPMGPSLQSLINSITQWDVTRWIFPQAIEAIRDIHRHGFLHRDIKPENILTGRNGLESKRIYIVDFGLCKKYRSAPTEHIPYREGKHMTGTVRYVSINVHVGLEQGRRDDLESLGYVMVFLLKKNLPWMHLGGTDRKEQQERIKAAKIGTTIVKLCDGLPSAFKNYFRHVRDLDFDSEPDYDLLMQFFRDCP